MTQTKLRALPLLGVALLLAGSGTAVAHHSFSQEFDPAKPIKIVGAVTRFDFVNPHSWIHVKAVNPRNGKLEEFHIEGGAPSALLRRGWNRNSLPPGTRIAVEGYAARDDEHRASAASLTFPDGRELSLGNPATEAVAAAQKRARN